MVRVDSWGEASGEIAADAYDLTLATVDGIEKRVRRAVEKTNRSFFKRLVAMSVGKKGPPDLGTHTPSWTPLTDKYLRWKKRKGLPTGFYSKYGHLKTALRALDAKSVFGVPSVYYREARATAAHNVRFDPKINRYRYKAGAVDPLTGQKVGGRLVKRLQAIDHIPRHMRVIPFPRVDDLAEKVLEGSHHDVYVRLTNPKPGRTLRPLLTPFMRWWLDTELSAAVEKAIRE